MPFEEYNVKVRWASYLIRSRLDVYTSSRDKDKAWKEAADAYWPTLMCSAPLEEKVSGLSRRAERAIQTIVSDARKQADLPILTYPTPQPRRRHQ